MHEFISSEHAAQVLLLPLVEYLLELLLLLGAGARLVLVCEDKPILHMVDQSEVQSPQGFQLSTGVLHHQVCQTEFMCHW